MRTLTARLTAAFKALRDAMARAWESLKTAVRTIRSGPHARGVLPSGPRRVRNSTGRAEPITTYPHRGRGSSDPGIGHTGQRRG